MPKDTLPFLARLLVPLLAVGSLHAAIHTVSSPLALKSLLLEGAVHPGDEIVWTDGIYDTVTIDFTGADGVPGKPITLRAETPGGVTFTGASTLHIGASYAVVSGFKFLATCDETAPWKVISFRSVGEKEASHTRLTDIVVEEAEAGLPVLKASKWVVLFGQYNRVDHCTFIGKRSHDNLMTVYLDESNPERPSWHRIDHNYFADRQNGALAGGDTNGWEIIRIGDSKTSHIAALCRVDNNLFERCDGEIEIISNKSGRNLYLSNTFVNCAGQLCLRHGFACLVADNLFVGTGQSQGELSGVRVIGPGHRVLANTFVNLNGKDVRGAIVLSDGVQDGKPHEYKPVTDAVIRGNLVVNCAQPLVVGTMHGRKVSDGKIVDTAPQSVTFCENTLIGAKPLITWVSPSVPDIHFADNLVYGPAVNIPWAESDKAPAGFTVQPSEAAFESGPDWQARVRNTRANTGASWFTR